MAITGTSKQQLATGKRRFSLTYHSNTDHLHNVKSPADSISRLWYFSFPLARQLERVFVQSHFIIVI